MNHPIDRIEDTLRKNGFFVSTTSGFSMWPMLRDRRDRVIIRPFGAERKPKKRDVVLYRNSANRYVLHRIVRFDGSDCIIQGDNTFFWERVGKDALLGYVEEFYRGDRHHLTKDRGYRFYAFFWRAIYPLRWLRMIVRRGLGKLYRFCRDKKEEK